MKDIKLEDFVALLQADLTSFKEEWLSHTNEKNWPQEMSEGDWYEQFLSFLTSKVES